MLNGKVAMALRHLLQIADALGLEWPEFFRRAYLAEEPAETPTVDAEDFDRKVMDLLRRLGLLPAETAADQRAS